MVFLKELFETVDFEKKKQQAIKSMQNYPLGNELMILSLAFCLLLHLFKVFRGQEKFVTTGFIQAGLSKIQGLLKDFPTIFQGLSV